MPHASDSATQREAEGVILDRISAQLGTPLAKRRIDLPGGAWVEVDGVAADLSVFAEAFARVGPMKDGQKRKVALDVLKLITLQRTYPEAQLVLAFCDAGAMNSLTGWLGEAIATWSLDRRLAPLGPELRNRLLAWVAAVANIAAEVGCPNFKWAVAERQGWEQTEPLHVVWTPLRCLRG